MNSGADQLILDQQFMSLALAEARKGRFWCSPNPHVGCVLVRDGAVIGTGFTQPAGGDHAEIQALKTAGNAVGATAYVTLEPCAHWGRTGPCADALIEAGITRVVAAIVDPHPEVAGKGLARLEAAGIEVLTGVMAAEAEAEIAGFLLRVRRGYGRVRLKIGCSLDGRTAMASGESQWITGASSREDVQRLRAMSSAIVTGSGTVLADDCSLTVRAEQLGLSGDDLRRATHRQPTRVVLDRRGRIGASAKVLAGDAPTWVFTGTDAASPIPSAEVIALSENGEGLDLGAVLRRLGSEGANEILVEAGPTLAGALLQAGLVDELVIYQAPVLLGATARPLAALSLEQLADGIQLDYGEISRLGADLRIIATVKPRN